MTRVMFQYDSYSMYNITALLKNNRRKKLKGELATKLNSTQQRILQMQVSDTSKSASSLYTIINKQYHFMTSSDRFPVPVRSAVKSNFTNWCCQNLSTHALNALKCKHQRWLTQVKTVTTINTELEDG